MKKKQNKSLKSIEKESKRSFIVEVKIIKAAKSRYIPSQKSNRL